MPFRHKLQTKRKQLIYRVNQQTNGFYYLQEGLVGLYQMTESGKERLLRVYGPGDYFGYRSLFSDRRYRLSTRCLLDSRLDHFHVHNINELHILDPELLKQLMQSVCQELGEAESRLSNIAALTARDRVLDSIIYLFQNFAEYPWTNREIAEFSGTETQTVIRICRQLKQEGLLDPTSRKIAPLDFELLERQRNWNC